MWLYISINRRVTSIKEISIGNILERYSEKTAPFNFGTLAVVDISYFVGWGPPFVSTTYQGMLHSSTAVATANLLLWLEDRSFEAISQI